MATEQYFQEPVSQDGTYKDSKKSLDKWKSESEPVNGSENNPGCGFDCNICLDIVQDPVVTLCGHLYCWPCIYKWINYQNAAESAELQKPQCPVCKTHVSQNTVIPLYSPGQSTGPTKTESLHLGMAIPERPPSPRCGVGARISTQPSTNRHADHNLRREFPQLVTIPTFRGMALTRYSPTTGMIGEMIYARVFGNAATTLYAYPNSYNLTGVSTPRARRQVMQTDRSLSRVSFFLFCCMVLCLLLF